MLKSDLTAQFAEYRKRLLERLQVNRIVEVVAGVPRNRSMRQA
jgi:hypothetical protein